MTNESRRLGTRPSGSRGSALLTLLLAACGPEQQGCAIPPVAPTDCATMSSIADWTVGFLAQDVSLVTGQSHRVSLNPPVLSKCPESLAGVTWTIEGVVLRYMVRHTAA